MLYYWRPHVPVATRRRQAERELARLQKKGHPVSPVVIQGRAIATTFWGKAWCDNLEQYSDFSNRLPRGRTYVRNGSVIDLQISPGAVKALVSGSDIYHVAVEVAPVPKTRWGAICTDCAGGIDSLVELLQGRFSKGVMERICQPRTGLFPAPAEVSFSCSCPDWASMCKHVAAVLYGVGARFDEKPELLFALRQVDEKDLIAQAGKGVPLSRKGPAAAKVLDEAEVADVFGLEMDQEERPKANAGARTAKRRTTKPPVEKEATTTAGDGKSRKGRGKAKPEAKAAKRRPAKAPAARKAAGRVRVEKTQRRGPTETEAAAKAAERPTAQPRAAAKAPRRASARKKGNSRTKAVPKERAGAPGRKKRIARSRAV